MKLSSIVQQVSVKKLKLNELNRQYFVMDEPAEITTLAKDIKKRGIQVPLVAMKDGTLLAGHRRLLIAKKLKLAKVPVQYIHGKMTREQQIEFLVKDNLLRRQLSPAEREALYRALYKDLDERILLAGSTLSIKANEVAKKTGINVKTVGYDLNRMRHKRKRQIAQASRVDVLNEKAVDRFRKETSRMLNEAQLCGDSTISEFIKTVAIARERLDSIVLIRQQAPKKLI